MAALQYADIFSNILREVEKYPGVYYAVTGFCGFV